MTVPAMTALPTAPSRGSSPATFTADADAFVAALPGFVTEANTLGTFCETQATNASSSAAAAATSETNAALSEAAAAASANFAGAWSSLTGPLNKPATVYHSGALWLLLNNLADVTASEPGVTADWALLQTSGVITFNNLFRG